MAIAAFFVGGAGISIAAPALFGAGGRLAPPEERGSAVATVTTLGYLGFLVGPPIVGGLAEAVGLRAASPRSPCSRSRSSSRCRASA